MIKIMTTGKKPSPEMARLINHYEKQLSGWWQVEWYFLDSQETLKKEDQTLISALKPTDYVILLDERGSAVNNQTLASLFQNQMRNSQKKPVFVIGGAYGVGEMLKRRANAVISFGPLVFPHNLVRLMLVEQIYRSKTVIEGLPYHHE